MTALRQFVVGVFCLSIFALSKGEYVSQGSSKSFVCGISSFPVFWDFIPARTNNHTVIGYKSDNKFYVDDQSRYVLEPYGMGTRLTIRMVSFQDEGVYNCKKFVDQSFRYEFTVEVIVPPTNPVIEQTHKTEEGGLYTMGCIINSVKPEPAIKWTMLLLSGGQFDVTSNSVKDTFKLANGTSKVISNLGIPLNRTIQGALCVCEITMEITGYGQLYKKEIRAYMTNALFKPLTPQVYGGDTTLIGGKLYTLLCVATYANPAANITWYRGDSTLSPSKVEINSLTGYYETHSYLTINASHKNDNATFTCNATNSLMTRDRDPPFLINRTINVDYAPIIGAWIVNKTVMRGDTLELDCAVKYSKPHSEILWRKNNVTVDTLNNRYMVYPYPATKWMSLVINGVSWRDMGLWQCEAYNYVGRAISGYIHVNVKHEPHCSQNTTRMTGRINASTLLTCIVRSYPNTNVTITWMYNGVILSRGRATPKYGDMYEASHTIVYVPRKTSDFGSFHCLAENSYGASPEYCEVILVADGSRKEALSVLSAGFGQNQYWIIIGILCGVIVLLGIFIITLIVAKKRDRDSTKSPNEVLDYSQNIQPDTSPIDKDRLDVSPTIFHSRSSFNRHLETILARRYETILNHDTDFSTANVDQLSARQPVADDDITTKRGIEKPKIFYTGQSSDGVRQGSNTASQ